MAGGTQRPVSALPRFDTSILDPIPALGVSVWFGIAAVRNYQISHNGLLEISTSWQPGSACRLLRLCGLQGRDFSPYTENTVHICAAAQIIMKLRVGAGPSCGGGYRAMPWGDGAVGWLCLAA